MYIEMVIGAGIFVLGTLFGVACTNKDNEFGLMMKNAILQHQLDECECERNKD